MIGNTRKYNIERGCEVGKDKRKTVKKKKERGNLRER